MSELLIEIFSEEIPARMQGRAADDLKRLVVDGLKARGLEVGEALSFATPRRLTLAVANVPAKSPAISEERKGPRVGAPEKAVEGFVKSAGLGSIKDAEIVKDEKKGDYYVAKIEKPGRAAADIVAETVPEIMGKFPWPKSMRWGSSTFQWVRPIHSVLCLLGGKVVPFEVAGVKSGDATRGHRFHGRDAIHAESFEDYGKKLMAAKVLLPASERQAAIAEQAREIAGKAKLDWIEDEALVAENAGLAEWPTVYMGSFDKTFLDVPAECLMTSMKQHQKCFSLRDPKTGKLANRFLLVSNLIPTDDGKEIIAGNEKVIAARLSDAKFFWDQDLKKPLDEMELALDGITFHEKLGTQKERVERIAELAHEIAGAVDADPDDARRAAQLCKADLVSGMVGEFPELQGLMGRYYAEKAGTKPEIARAIELHYKPKGASDTVPKEEDGDSVAIAVALADKLDTLVGFWAIGEKPTGSGDPYQLRRAALGIIRIVLENDLRVPLVRTILRHYVEQYIEKVFESDIGQIEVLAREDLVADLLAFFADRLKVYLRDAGKRHDLIDAVFALSGQDDLALIVKRVEALDGFLQTEDGTNLLAGVKRASNILAIEEKKDKTRYDGDVAGPLLVEPAERDLAAAIAKVKFDTIAAINVENFEGAMRALSELRAPVDTFFDDVIVNADDKKLRENRLKLLNEIRAATLNVADFSKIAG
ncbi:MAG: glycine--tRNA ligase subunit beta [Hyphomicrobiaceae bacterium]|nr:glycine--tRNA ligase subunit beta [Hyphomicrobiaceae bacterium]MCC0007267.1 glycine--tRNA ligase subunit beta [Hyphomicrobiaceae bacterium]